MGNLNISFLGGGLMKGKGLFSKRNNEPIDLREIDDLIERGLDNDEIAKELGIPKVHVDRMIQDIDKDF